MSSDIKSNVSLIEQLSDRNCTTISIKYKMMNKVNIVNNYHKTAFEQ